MSLQAGAGTQFRGHCRALRKSELLRPGTRLRLEGSKPRREKIGLLSCATPTAWLAALRPIHRRSNVISGWRLRRLQRDKYPADLSEVIGHSGAGLCLRSRHLRRFPQTLGSSALGRRKRGGDDLRFSGGVWAERRSGRSRRWVERPSCGPIAGFPRSPTARDRGTPSLESSPGPWQPT